MRDIPHEQISASTTKELLSRRADIRRGAVELFGTRCYKLCLLSELHGIESELYCRENGIESKPWVNYGVPVGWEPNSKEAA